MTAFKLNIEEFDDSDYKVIAIHSGLEDFRLAYFINKILNIRLSILQEQLELKVESTYALFNHYNFIDLDNDVLWNLIPNKTHYQSVIKESTSLFNDHATAFRTHIYLLPELKSVDFLLKIDDLDETFDIDSVIEKLKTLKSVSLVYELQQNKIKNKNNLIF